MTAYNTDVNREQLYRDQLHAVTLLDADDFVARVKPVLAQRDLKGLMTLLKTHWSCDQIFAFLSSPHQDARKVAALAMGLVGSKSCVPRLAEQLKDSDRTTNQMAEHALWSIWIRGGTPKANDEVCRGIGELESQEFFKATEHFTQAIQADPTFAEAYNQRAIAYYLMEQYPDSVEDCHSAVARMPCHFGAWAGMGHGFAHMGQTQEAIRCYRRALAINPHLSCVQEVLEQLGNG